MKAFKILSFLVFVALAGTAEAATLSLSPATQTLNVGDNFNVDINLDTQGQTVDGVDVNALRFNPALLQIQGSQITPGALMSDTLVNSINNITGVIIFSQVPTGGTTYTGSGKLATVVFKALAAGTANVTFDYTSGLTTDSNVASNGSDILTSVISGNYTISAPASPDPSSGGSSGGGSSSGSSSGGSSGGGGSSRGGSASGGSSSGNTTCTSGSQTFSLTRNLAFRSEGNDVKNLQTFLVQKGYTTADNITGFFGLITQSSLQKFQKALGIVSSGSPKTTGYGAAGPLTRARINALLPTSSCSSSQNASKVGTQSLQAQIQELQRQVNELLLKLQKMQ